MLASPAAFTACSRRCITSAALTARCRPAHLKRPQLVLPEPAGLLSAGHLSSELTQEGFREHLLGCLQAVAWSKALCLCLLQQDRILGKPCTPEQKGIQQPGTGQQALFP